MSDSLRHEIQQQAPFVSLQQEAFLNLGRTAAALDAMLEQVLRPHGVSLAQYNVLRILRGAAPAGLGRNAIRDRLVARMPDVTRLLDRLEALGLVARERSRTDRRLVSTALTARGADLLAVLDEPVRQAHDQQWHALSDAQLRTLIALLTLARREA